MSKSSPLISRLSAISRPFSTEPCSRVLFEQQKLKDYDLLGLLVKSVSGIVLGSGLGFWAWSSSSQSSVSFADWATRKTTIQDGGGFEEPRKYLLAVVFGSISNCNTMQNVLNMAKDEVSLLNPTNTMHNFSADSYRRKIFFNYEKRIRMRSPPEKVFEYFASYRGPDGEVFMTPADLMRAVVPVFPPSESNLVRDGYLRGEQNPGHLRCTPSSFFMLFDTNSDGLVSFAEYIFFVTLLSIPESSFTVAFKMFDLDNSGEIDMEEFKKVMALMRAHNRQGAHHRDGLRTGLKVRHSVEDGGLLEFFFGKDGKTCLQHSRFVEFLKELHDEILRLEFAHYDYKQRGTISVKDFALSMVASADMSLISKFLRRVDELSNEPHLREKRITLEEFMVFAELRKQLQPLSLAIFSYGKVNGYLTKEDFQRAASNVCGVSLTDTVVDIIYHVFDVNCDGSLSVNEFIKVLHSREKDISRTNTEGVLGLILCWLNGSKNCSMKHVLF